MVRAVVRYPDPGLKRSCRAPTDGEAERVLADLVDTMRVHSGCVGLAACQIGEPMRVAVVDVRGHRLAESSNGLLALVDAVIEERAGSHLGREGCLSLPAFTADVKRARRVRVTTRVMDGGAREVWCAGFEARAVQHELDHLDGVLILDRVTSVRALHPRLLQAGTNGNYRGLISSRPSGVEPSTCSRG